MAASLRMDFKPPLITIFILLIDTVYVGTGVSTVNISIDSTDVNKSYCGMSPHDILSRALREYSGPSEGKRCETDNTG
jgi:hypothetical protein